MRAYPVGLPAAACCPKQTPVRLDGVNRHVVSDLLLLVLDRGNDDTGRDFITTLVLDTNFPAPGTMAQ